MDSKPKYRRVWVYRRFWKVNIAKQTELENKVQKLVDSENADIFVTPTRFTKKIEGTETVILEKTYTTDGQELNH